MPVRSWLVLASLLVTHDAFAIGLCENTPRQYSPPRLFDETTNTFAIPATQVWCDEVQDGAAFDETRGVVSFIELRDTSGQVTGIASNATGADAKRLTAMFGTVTKPATALAKFKKLVRTSAGQLGRCTVRTTWKRSPVPLNGFPAGTLGIEVIAGKQTLASAEIGLAAAQRREEVAVAAHFRRDTRTVAVFVRLPTCSGPPPGYFGPDDGGDCYAEDEPVIKLFDANQTPALAGCFP